MLAHLKTLVVVVVKILNWFVAGHCLCRFSCTVNHLRQIGAKQDEPKTSNLTKYSEEVAMEIKRSILEGEEISRLVFLKLKEALEALDLADLFVPVANSNSAREAGESVKNAVAMQQRLRPK